MKRLIYLVLILSIFHYCAPKQEKVERVIEDGVEVIVNHLEPYQIKNEPITFILKEEFVIDTENFEIARIGLTDIECFDVDSEGNIYFLNRKSGAGNHICKFDKKGRFITSFGSTGQGPGEFQGPSHLEINNQDNIVVTDPPGDRIIIFNKDSSFVKGTPIGLLVRFVSCLDNSKFLTFEISYNSINSEYWQFPLILVNSQFEEVKKLDIGKRLNLRIAKTKKRKDSPLLLCWSISRESVYVGNEERGYEIWKYDLDGNLIQKIKKEYRRVHMSEEYKKERLERTLEKYKKRTFFPEYFPPYQSFFTDDSGRLFVMTYEEGENPGEFMLDIFNSKGAFIGRKSLNIFVWNYFLWGKIKGSRLYCLQEKESGYKELVVYKMRWE